MSRFLIIFLFIPHILFPIDFGLSMDESVSIRNGDLTNRFNTTLWSENDFGDKGQIEFQGIFSHSIISQPEFPYYFDINSLKYINTLENKDEDQPQIIFSIGRYPIIDQTAFIIAHKLDGISIDFNYSLLKLYNSLSYSGLLWKLNSSISPSILDTYYLEKKNTVLASPRIIGLTGIAFPSLIKQNLGIEFLYQIDMREEDHVIEDYQSYSSEGIPVEGGGMLDSYYVSLKSKGSLFLPLFNYSFSYVYNGGRSMSRVTEDLKHYKYSEISAHLVNLKLEKYLPKVSNSLIKYNLLFSSGDNDFNGYQEGNFKDKSNNFVPLSLSLSGIVFSPTLGNILVNDISYSLTPIDNLSTELKFLTFSRTTTGPISEDGINPNSNELYLGSELDFIVDYRPLSDLGLTLSTGFYFPSEKVYDKDYLEVNKILITITLNISFSL